MNAIALYTWQSTIANSTTVKPRFAAPLFTTNLDLPWSISFPVFKLILVKKNKQKPDLYKQRTPITAGFLFPMVIRGFIEEGCMRACTLCERAWRVI